MIKKISTFGDRVLDILAPPAKAQAKAQPTACRLDGCCDWNVGRYYCDNGTWYCANHPTCR